jgi:hypothetical protein
MTVPVVMVMALVVLAAVVTGRIVGAMLGQGRTGATDGKCQGDGDRCRQTGDRLQHVCLLTDDFRLPPRVCEAA